MKFPEIIKADAFLEITVNKIKKEPNQKDVLYYINFVHNKLADRLTHIYSSLPDYSQMDEYYLLMSKNIVPENILDKYKNHYLVTIHLINSISEKYKRFVKREKNYPAKLKLKKEYLGRIKSILNKLDGTNEILIGFGKYFKAIPNPQKLFTIVLVGVPNTGKTTLLAQITTADPEINSYSFTTKTLNFGYFKKREQIIQVVDTPGLIHDDFKDMNFIEKQAIVAIKTLADVIIFLYNQHQGYDEQRKILDRIIDENSGKPIFVFPSFGGKMKDFQNITLEDILDKNFKEI
jgi:nucleolar GTP-binding protein